MDVARTRRSLPDGPTALPGKLEAMMATIDETVVTVRRIATELRPGVLDDLGLVAAMEWQTADFERRSGIRCTIRAPIDDQLIEPSVSTTMFRILQESLTNVARHSGASSVTVTLEHADESLVLEIRDNGVGIRTPETVNVRSIGLVGMRERAQLVGGEFRISGSSGSGTTVRVQIPFAAAAQA
jgi:signal transduction histidine kinase